MDSASGDSGSDGPAAVGALASETALATLVQFTHILRQEGIVVPPDAQREFVAGVIAAGISELYFVGRCTLAKRHEDLAIYDRAFASFFGGAPSQLEPTGEPPKHDAGELELGAGEGPGQREDVQIGAASPTDLLREKRFADCTDEELAVIGELIAHTPMWPPQRRTRRYAVATRGELDLRQTIRGSLRTDGDPVRRKHRARSSSPRRLVLMLDVSASMSAYARALMMFSHIVRRRVRGAEMFCFGTRLTRLTDSLDCVDPGATLAAVSEIVVDRDAGTRIGESLHQFLKQYGHVGVARGAVIVICSDGLEFGDPALLGNEMRHLARLAHRVIWLNPLAEDPRFRPVMRGMVAALPAIDLLTSGHDFRSLENLLGVLASSLAGIDARVPAPQHSWGHSGLTR